MIKWKIFRNKRECSDDELHISSMFMRKMDIMVLKEEEEERSRRSRRGSKMNPVDRGWSFEKWMGFGTYENYLNELEDRIDNSYYSRFW